MNGTGFLQSLLEQQDREPRWQQEQCTQPLPQKPGLAPLRHSGTSILSPALACAGRQGKGESAFKIQVLTPFGSAHSRALRPGAWERGSVQLDQRRGRSSAGSWAGWCRGVLVRGGDWRCSCCMWLWGGDHMDLAKAKGMGRG